jgi:pilus assembly protein CpaD
MTKYFSNYSRQCSVALLLAATTLAGCITDAMDMQEAQVQPAAYSGSDSYPISVVKGPITLEVASIGSGLQPQQINAVQGFAHQAKQAGVSPIKISRPSGGGNSARIASEVANLLSQQGVSRKMIHVITYPGPADAPVNVSYISTYAQTKACGQWPQDVTDTEDNARMSNHGCSVQANIAAMISNPETLVVPEGSDPIRANTRVNNIKVLERDPTARTSFWSIF